MSQSQTHAGSHMSQRMPMHTARRIVGSIAFRMYSIAVAKLLIACSGTSFTDKST